MTLCSLTVVLFFCFCSHFDIYCRNPFLWVPWIHRGYKYTVCVDAPADVGCQPIFCDRDHVGWHRSVSRQPVWVVITRGIATVIFCVTEQEGHGGETREAASHCAWDNFKYWKRDIKMFLYFIALTQHSTVLFPCSYQGPDREFAHFHWWREGSNQSRWGWSHKDSLVRECSDCVWLS